jgi:N-acetylornithine carbamoyltransferase
MAARLGSHVTVACPPEFVLSERVVAEASLLARQHGGTVSVSHDLADACKNAHVVYAKSWTPAPVSSTADTGTRLRHSYRDWRVTADLMRRTDGGVFMHCLPVRRNVVVDDAVLDGPASIVQRQARMRVDANVAILNALIDQNS